jgi:hypothetical protein
VDSAQPGCITAVSVDSDPIATPAGRAAERLAFAARARSRAEQMVLTTQVLLDRAAAACRFTEEATARINEQQIGEAPLSSGR